MSACVLGIFCVAQRLKSLFHQTSAICFTCKVLQHEVLRVQPVSWLCCGFVTTGREPLLPWRSCRLWPKSQKPGLLEETHKHTHSSDMWLACYHISVPFICLSKSLICLNFDVLYIILIRIARAVRKYWPIWCEELPSTLMMDYFYVEFSFFKKIPATKSILLQFQRREIIAEQKYVTFLD